MHKAVTHKLCANAYNGSLHPSTQHHTPITKPVRPVCPLSYPHPNQYTPFLPTNNTRIRCYSNSLSWKFASIPYVSHLQSLVLLFSPGLSPSSFCSLTVCKQKTEKEKKLLCAEKMRLGCFLLCEHRTPGPKTGLKIV